MLILMMHLKMKGEEEEERRQLAQEGIYEAFTALGSPCTRVPALIHAYKAYSH